jgi:hypothetical protein
VKAGTLLLLKRNKQFSILLLGLFLFRLFFGLCSEFWFEDERQIYLLGLKFYATRTWPYFGPDVSNGVQIPGALQGLLVGSTFFVLPIPEAPFILLNILSFAGLALLAWYCCNRLPSVPRWFVWVYLMTCPWTLNLSTHVFNPSYLLVASIAFFVGALETYPQTTRDLIAPQWTNLMMGAAALFWVMQLHLSWVVLVPFALVSIYFQFTVQGRNAVRSLLWFFAGALLTGSLLAPTYLKYGLRDGSGGTDSTVAFNASNLRGALNLPEGILARFLSLASYELPRFIGHDSATRLLFLKEHWWLVPIFLFLLPIGLLQPITLILLWFRQQAKLEDWRAIKYLALFTILLLYLLFVFSIKPPLSHTFYVTFPVAMIYALHCWSGYLQRPRWKIFAGIVLISGVIFHFGLALANYESVSLYVNRKIPQAAIERRDPSVLGERREGARY